MACEVPVIASRVGGLPEVITDGVTGFICGPDDIAGMAERGIQVLTDPALQSRVGLAAAADVQQRFCVSVVVPQYEQYYEEVLAGRVR
jgi:glycosyltransferase involved in cell wall biosynthesis